MFPILVIAIGIAVLVLGKRLAVLGGAVGALLGLGLVQLFPALQGGFLPWIIVLGLTILGVVGGGFAKGIVEVVIWVIGALAGAAIVLGVYDLFNIDGGLLKWLLVVVGAAVGLVVIRRARRGSQDWGIIILASLVGALLIGRGLGLLLPSLDGLLKTIIVVALAAIGIVFQGGVLDEVGRSTTASLLPPASPAATGIVFSRRAASGGASILVRATAFRAAAKAWSTRLSAAGPGSNPVTWRVSPPPAAGERDAEPVGTARAGPSPSGGRGSRRAGGRRPRASG